MLWVDHIAGHHYVTLNAGLSNYLDSGQAPATGQWQHLSATYDGTTARYYVNGTQVATKTFTGNVGDSNTWRIGAYGATPVRVLRGRHRRRADLQPRADRGRGPGGHERARRVRHGRADRRRPAFAKTGARACDDRHGLDRVDRQRRRRRLPRVPRRHAGRDHDLHVVHVHRASRAARATTLGVEAFDDAEQRLAAHAAHREQRRMRHDGADRLDHRARRTATQSPAASPSAPPPRTTTASPASSSSSTASNLGGEDTSSPYSIAWDAAAAGPGSSHADRGRARRRPATPPRHRRSPSRSRQPAAGSSPVAAYSFDDGAGTIAGDATGNGHPGTVVGATWATGQVRVGAELQRRRLARRPRAARDASTSSASRSRRGSRRARLKRDVGVVGSWNSGQNGGPMLWVDRRLRPLLPDA